MSIAAKAFTRYLFTSANRFASKEAVLASADTNSDGVTPPSRLFRNCNITSERIDGRLVITVSPKTGGSGKQLFYIHGGGYVHGIIKPHWWLIADLIKRTGATVTVPIYRLIQDGGTASSEVPWLIDIYESLAEQGPVYVAGDSAGGNLSLVLALALKDMGIQAPQEIFAFSSVTDGHGDNPKIQQVAAQDPILALPGARWVGQAWAGSRR